LRRKEKAKNPTAGDDVTSASKTRGNEIYPISKKSLFRRGGRNYFYISARAQGKFSIERGQALSCLLLYPITGRAGLHPLILEFICQVEIFLSLEASFIMTLEIQRIYEDDGSKKKHDREG
jgi:hypothetical protein